VDPLPRSRHVSPHAVSVAELLCRYDTGPVIPRPRPTSEPAEPVPVSTLLRREGRARRALDRPLVPRGHSRPDPAPTEPPLHGTRKATAAAGALFVVGAVFGAGALEESLLRPDAGPGDGAEGSGSTAIGPGVDAERDAGPGVTLASTAGLLPGADRAPVTGADIGAAALLPGLAVPGPDSATPGPGTPAAPAVPAPTAPGVAPGIAVPGAAPGAAAPGPGGSDPGGSDPAGPGAAGPGAGPADPGPPLVTVEVPDLGTPPVEVPGIALPPTPLGPVTTPSITFTEATAVAPDLTVSLDEDGLAVDSTDAVLVSPDAAIGALDAGPVGLTGTDATVGDLRIEGAELLRVGSEPEVAVPAATLTPTTLETPDLRLGGTVVEVPDLALPELSTPEVPVVETVTGLLGVSGDGDTGDGDTEGGDTEGGDTKGGDTKGGDTGEPGSDGGSPLALVEDVPLVGGLLG
jgi:hypothetical protein